MDNPHKVTFRHIAESINKNWTLDDWIQWPPDTFALCASIINRTGLYRYCLIDMDWWNNKTWKTDIDDLSNKWTKHCSDLLIEVPAGEHPIKNKYYQTLVNEWKAKDEINLDHFRPLSPLFNKSTTSEQRRTKDLAKALLYFYILADASCGSLGLLGQSLKIGQLKNRVFMTVANLLLNNTGSLSTVTKFHGVVLPKMRTPRSGLNPRSLTHQLTFHNTEVEVIWRAFPRLDDRRKSLNILAVPYPKKIKPKDFDLMEDSYQYVRYFKGKTDRPDNELFIKGLVDCIWTCAKAKNEVDIIVFPEMALSEYQYHKLLEEFSVEFRQQEQCWQLPIIITGIAKENTKEETGYVGIDKTFHNEVRMAVFFGGEWYTTTQRKHHRWQLDRSQIRQYQLEAFFSADQRWFEFSSIAQRRLTILAPYDWLALSALICEDLARQEPVSEVIRGIGPTLLMALLSDGPQLQSRWSARYASILADDPGTAVLSLTSEGMAKRSKAPDLKPVKSPVVGLWKDMIRGFREFSLKKDSDALLFTISATFEHEFTLDGRSDGGFASVFQLDNIRPKQIKFEEKQLTDSSDRIKLPPKTTDRGDEWRNIRELSALQFAVDALLDILIDETTGEKPKQVAVDLIFTLLLGQNTKKSAPKFKNRIINSVAIAWKDPTHLGIAATPPGKRSETLQKAVDDLKQFVKIVCVFSNKRSYKLLEEIIDKCEKMLRNKQRKPENNQIPMAFLYHIYNRIATWEPAKNGGYEIEGLVVENAVLIRKRIIAIIKPKRQTSASIDNSVEQSREITFAEPGLTTLKD